MSATAGAIIGGAFGLGATALNNILAGNRTAEDRYENYELNEAAAEAADRRTRALYADFYSPEALLKQYKAAGLSPSMMFGGTPGQGGTSGAQGAGASGLQTPFVPYSIVEAAQAAALTAQAEKTKAETKNITTDTQLKDLEREMTQMTLEQFKDEWNIINSRWVNSETGEQTSIFELADNHYTFESFLEAVRKDEASGKTNFKASTEAEIKTLRNIYESASRFNRDIMTLSQETVSAKFQMDITRALEKEGFINLNAQAAIAQLRQEVATNELTEAQKEAWNNLINRLGKKGSTTRDIAIVLGMILGNFASHTGIKVNLGK